MSRTERSIKKVNYSGDSYVQTFRSPKTFSIIKAEQSASDELAEALEEMAFNIAKRNRLTVRSNVNSDAIPSAYDDIHLASVCERYGAWEKKGMIDWERKAI